MFRSLVWKELRDGWGFGLLALLWQVIGSVVLVREASRNPVGAFEIWDLQASIALVSIGFGTVLGLWQSVPEAVLGTDSFLAHTARVRARIVAAKMTAGLALVTVAIMLPLLAGVVTVLHLVEWIVPLGWADSRYLWITAASGYVAYLGALAVGLRGVPWREGVRQLVGAGVIGLGVAVALQSPFFGIAVASLVVTGGIAAVWAFTGYAAREF